ncbi:MAG: metal ABC transporter permease [Balneolales bacterium]|nr:metal ABC transporter permease [Balneolales bacterium]
MNDFITEFILLGDPNIRWVLSGSVLFGLAAGALGCFAILRERALVGDAVAHAILPGVCLAFIFTGDKDPFALLIGSVIFGWVSLVVMDYIVRNTKLSSDTAIGMVLSVFFGLGVVLLTYIQSTGNVNQSGLDAFLFGSAASMLPEDVKLFGMVSILVLLALVFLFKELKLVSFDPGYASVIGYPMKRMEFLIATLMVVTITAGLQAVGVVLMASMLIIPAAAARYWTDSLLAMLIIAAAAGAFSAIFGAAVSYGVPSMPTGPWMVVSCAIFFTISYFFAPVRGEYRRKRQRRLLKKKITGENLLKVFYKLYEMDDNRQKGRTISDLVKRRNMKPGELKKSLQHLVKNKWLNHYSGNPEAWTLTDAGFDEAKRVVRLHRLWELYLTQKLDLEGDHVHDDAESMEHMITPELEAQLIAILNNPERDPHQRVIPGQNGSNIAEGGK